MLVGSLVFSVLLSGAETWPQLTAASARRVRAVFMRVQRMIVGNFRGTAAAVCDLDVLRELGASSLAVELRKARLMCVPPLVCVEQSLLAAVLQSSPDDPWVKALETDLEDMRGRSAGKLSALPPFSQDPQPWCKLWRYSPGPWKELVRLVYKGVVECGTAEAPVPEDEVQCSQCERWFGSVGALRSHAVRTHGMRDQLRRFVPPAECPACSKGFPSRARALHHARYSSKSCQQRLLNGEFPMCTESELERLDLEMAQFLGQVSQRRCLVPGCQWVAAVCIHAVLVYPVDVCKVCRR